MAVTTQKSMSISFHGNNKNQMAMCNQIHGTLKNQLPNKHNNQIGTATSAHINGSN